VEEWPLKPAQQAEVIGMRRWLESEEKEGYALSHTRHAAKIGLCIKAARELNPAIRITIIGNSETEAESLYQAAPPVTNQLLRQAFPRMTYASIRWSQTPVPPSDLIILANPTGEGLVPIIQELRALQPNARFLYSFNISTKEPFDPSKWGRRISEHAPFDPFEL
jgi:hypothetical protein